jgi:hypothetical protein
VVLLILDARLAPGFIVYKCTHVSNSGTALWLFQAKCLCYKFWQKHCSSLKKFQKEGATFFIFYGDLVFWHFLILAKISKIEHFPRTSFKARGLGKILQFHTEWEEQGRIRPKTTKPNYANHKEKVLDKFRLRWWGSLLLCRLTRPIDTRISQRIVCKIPNMSHPKFQNHKTTFENPSRPNIA